ncbi:unnamed protein product [Colias eurytheme]|nr:unnamed protein product [Colias eurytheme]
MKTRQCSVGGRAKTSRRNPASLPVARRNGKGGKPKKTGKEMEELMRVFCMDPPNEEAQEEEEIEFLSEISSEGMRTVESSPSSSCFSSPVREFSAAGIRICIEDVDCLVFLQYRNETKRALLPNEITSLDTVKALFVRSFPKQLTMDYLDSPLVKIYIHDGSKDMFYELEDMRAHLRDIRDRSVLRLFESKDLNGGVFPGALGVGSVRLPALAATSSSTANLEDQNTYFSEPEIDSDHLSQHVHKSKVE